MPTISTEVSLTFEGMSPLVAAAAAWEGSPSTFEAYAAHTERSMGLTWGAMLEAALVPPARSRPSNRQPVSGVNRLDRRAAAARRRRS